MRLINYRGVTCAVYPHVCPKWDSGTTSISVGKRDVDLVAHNMRMLALSPSVRDTVDLEVRGLQRLCGEGRILEWRGRTGPCAGAKSLAACVPHLIQDRTDAELGEIADRALDEVVAALARA